MNADDLSGPVAVTALGVLGAVLFGWGILVRGSLLLALLSLLPVALLYALLERVPRRPQRV